MKIRYLKFRVSDSHGMDGTIVKQCCFHDGCLRWWGGMFIYWGGPLYLLFHVILFIYFFTYWGRGKLANILRGGEHIFVGWYVDILRWTPVSFILSYFILFIFFTYWGRGKLANILRMIFSNWSSLRRKKFCFKSYFNKICSQSF